MLIKVDFEIHTLIKNVKLPYVIFYYIHLVYDLPDEIKITSYRHFILFFKLYFIDCSVTVVPISPLYPPTQHPLLPQAILTPLFMSMGHVYKFLGYSISRPVL